MDKETVIYANGLTLAYYIFKKEILENVAVINFNNKENKPIQRILKINSK